MHQRTGETFRSWKDWASWRKERQRIFNIMSYEPCSEEVQDSIGDRLVLSNKLVLRKTIYSRGNESEVFEHIIGE